MKKKNVNPAKFLHEVYTEQGGVKEYNKNQRALGALKFAGSILLLQKIGDILYKIEHMEIKAKKILEEEDR